MSRGTNISKLLISLRPIIACAKPVLVLSNQMSKIWAQPCYPPPGGGAGGGVGIRGGGFPHSDQKM